MFVKNATVRFFDNYPFINLIPLMKKIEIIYTTSIITAKAGQQMHFLCF